MTTRQIAKVTANHSEMAGNSNETIDYTVNFVNPTKFEAEDIIDRSLVYLYVFPFNLIAN